MIFDVVIMCESVKKGCKFYAVTYDRELQRRFSASGDTALEAIGWLFDEHIAVSVYGAGPAMALNSDDVPGSRFPRLAAAQQRANAVRDAMQKDANEWAAKHGVAPPTIKIVTPSTSSFDNQIPRAAELTPPVVKPSAAARRSSARKKVTK